jgi:hypothetical protein
MPTISDFYGIHIQMYFDDKHAPHFHAIHAEHRAQINVTTGKIISGALPPRAYRLVREWWKLYRAELKANWEWARRRVKLSRIPGLEYAMPLVGNSKYPSLMGVQAVRVLRDHLVHVTFTDGTERDIDLEPHLWGTVFESIRNDPQLFASVFVDPIGQVLAWPGDIDLDTDTLYYSDESPPWAENCACAECRARRSRARLSARTLRATRVRNASKAKPGRRARRVTRQPAPRASR